MHNGIDLPREGPHISGEQSQYQIGDTLNINCTSGKSHPSSSIQWFINDEPVSCLFNNIVDISLPCVSNATLDAIFFLFLHVYVYVF